MASKMDRDTFEEWLEDHRDEALNRVEAERMPLTKWISLYAKGLKAEAEEEQGDTEDDTEDDVEPMYFG